MFSQNNIHKEAGTNNVHDKEVHNEPTKLEKEKGQENPRLRTKHP